MKELKRILVCVNTESPDIGLVERAGAMAKRSGAAVKIFHVITDYPEDLSEWWNVRNPKKLHDKIVKQRQGVLDGLTDDLKASGVEKVSSEIRWGVQFMEIIHEVRRSGHDLIMITAQHSSSVARGLLECPSMDLMRHCPCALWVSKGKVAKRTKRILATIGWKGGAEGGEVVCDTQNAAILRTAAVLAKAEDSELHILHALPLFGGKGQKGNKLRSDLVDFLDNLRTEIVAKCGPRLTTLGIEVREENVHLLTGGAAAVIPGFIEKGGMDLVVMGTVARTGLPGLFIGNTAVKVFAEVGCPVVAVKPDSFVSLVEKEEQAGTGKGS